MKSKFQPLLAIALFVLSALLILAASFELLYSSLPDFLKQFTFRGHWRHLRKYDYLIALGEFTAALLVWLPTLKLKRDWALTYLNFAIRIGLGAMFILASLFKIKDPAQFAMLTAQYQLLPQFTINIFALWLPPLEFLVGVLLITGPKVRWTSWLVFGMFIMFIIALAQAVIRDLGITCGCFELEGAMDKKDAWVSLVRDIILLPPTLFLALKGRDCWIWNLFKKE